VSGLDDRFTLGCKQPMLSRRREDAEGGLANHRVEFREMACIP